LRYDEFTQHINVIENIPDMRRAFPDGGGIFQKDVFSCLSPENVKTIFRKQKFNVLDYHGYSPNLNPVEKI